MKKEPRPKKQTRLESLALSAEQNYSQFASSEVTRRRNILEYANAMLQGEILELTYKLGDARLKFRDNEAEITGLTRVLDKR